MDSRVSSRCCSSSRRRSAAGIRVFAACAIRRRVGDAVSRSVRGDVLRVRDVDLAFNSEDLLFLAVRMAACVNMPRLAARREAEDGEISEREPALELGVTAVADPLTVEEDLRRLTPTGAGVAACEVQSVLVGQLSAGAERALVRTARRVRRAEFASGRSWHQPFPATGADLDTIGRRWSPSTDLARRRLLGRSATPGGLPRLSRPASRLQ